MLRALPLRLAWRAFARAGDMRRATRSLLPAVDVASSAKQNHRAPIGRGIPGLAESGVKAASARSTRSGSSSTGSAATHCAAGVRQQVATAQGLKLLQTPSR